MIIENLIIEYGPIVGYGLLLLGSFIEGESVVLTAGFFAYKGYLSLFIVMLIAFLGSAFADQLLFFLGKKYGIKWLDKRPKLKVKTDKVFVLLHKYNTLFIIGFRFIYGIRTISPFVIGTSGIPIRRFAYLNLLAAAAWSILSCGAGYLIGYCFSDQIDQGIIHALKYQKYILLVLLLVFVVFIVFLYYKHYINNDNKPAKK